MLIHWRVAEALPLVSELEKSGFEVTCPEKIDSGALSTARRGPLDFRSD